MKTDTPLICLITPGHIASTPRLVKNADALTAAGFRVHVVAGRNFTPADPLDHELLERAAWSRTLVDSRNGAAAFARKLLRRAARGWMRAGASASAHVAACAHHAEALHLGRVAARVPAQFYFGHCLAGLPAAALAAQARGVGYGFDAEDYHEGEEITDPIELRARQILHARFLSGCAVFTAAAPMIADRYRELYRVGPKTVLNTFPIAEAPDRPSAPKPISEARPAQCYWFSQTIGPGRGLEAAIAIMANLRTPIELQLRGFVSDNYANQLRHLAQQAGLVRPLCFLPPAAPAEMVRLAATADLGLAIEETQPLNRDLCLTNKIFAYLLAGVPQLLSSTRAQAALAPELGDATLLVDLAKPAEAAARLDTFFADQPRVAKARETAWRLARTRFCWEVERSAFVSLIRHAVAQ